MRSLSIVKVDSTSCPTTSVAEAVPNPRKLTSVSNMAAQSVMARQFGRVVSCWYALGSATVGLSPNLWKITEQCISKLRPAEPRKVPQFDAKLADLSHEFSKNGREIAVV